MSFSRTDGRLSPVSGPLGFAHRGGSADAPENTLHAFRLALSKGVGGLETDVWMTADGVPVLHHDGRVRRRPIGELRASDLPPDLPSLRDLYDACGTGFDLSLDLKDGRSAEAVVAVARAAGHDLRRVWLCGGATGALAWRSVDPAVRVVAGADPRRVGSWTEHLRRLADGGVDAVNVRRRRWTRDRVQVAHDLGLLAFGWDAQSARRIRALLDLGVDGVYSDHVGRLVTAISSRG
jgi:glycerophosphoryl diester phosphodiesterase